MRGYRRGVRDRLRGAKETGRGAGSASLGWGAARRLIKSNRAPVPRDGPRVGAGGGSSDVGFRAGGGGELARASPRAGALEGRCTHVKLRTPLFRRPHAAEKLSQPSRIPPRRFRRRGRDGRRSPERLRRCPRDGPVRTRHLRDDARGGVRRHRRRIEPAAVPARRARTDDPSRARAVLVSRPHRPPDFCRGSWGPRGGRT